MLDAWIAPTTLSFSVDSSKTVETAVDQMIAALGNVVELFDLARHSTN